MNANFDMTDREGEHDAPESAIRVLARTPAPAPETLRRARAQLQQRIVSAGRPTDGRGPGRFRVPFDRRLLLLGAAASVVAITLVVPQLLPGRPGPPPSGVVAADAAGDFGTVGELMEHLAAQVESGSLPSRQEAAYWYEASVSSQDGRDWRKRELWVGHDREALLRTEDENGVGQDEKLDRSSYFGVIDGPGTAVDWDGLWALPLAPQELAERLRRGFGDTGNGPEAELYVAVNDLLRESPAPPALRATAYRVIGGIAGVRLVGAVEDELGRPGYAIERDNGGSTERYVYDVETGLVLQESSGAFTSVTLGAGWTDDGRKAPAEAASLPFPNALRPLPGPDTATSPPTDRPTEAPTPTS